MTDPQSNWRSRLRGDPTRWLLEDSENASVSFWFLRDIVGRPEDAPNLVILREQILYSRAVQELFATQQEDGFWESGASLDLPRYRATLWNLALLAELGLARNSRRARAACEFVLQNHLNEDGAFTGLRELSYGGLLLRTLVYFGHGNDPRLEPAFHRLAQDAAEGNVFAVWAFADLTTHSAADLPRNALEHSEYSAALSAGVERILVDLARGCYHVLGSFPPFESLDAILALRVLSLVGKTSDRRTAQTLEKVWDLQDENGRWSLRKGYDGLVPVCAEPEGGPSKWATLNALRILTRLA